MLRLVAQRRAVLATAAAAVAVTHTPKDKLPIYPETNQDVLLIETPSELEKQIGKARRAVTATYLDARAQVQGVVSRWISVEESVEKRIKSLIAPDEPLTPGILYVGVATLTGSVLARNRSLPMRLALPPTLLLLSLNHFLPKTSHNVSAYFGTLEDTYLPGVAEKHDIAKAHSAMTWARIQDATVAGRERVSESVLRAVVSLEEATGLKLQETLGWSKGVVRAVEGQARETAAVVQQKAGEAGAVVAHKVEEVKGAVEQNVHDATVAGEKKTDEPPKKLKSTRRLFLKMSTAVSLVASSSGLRTTLPSYRFWTPALHQTRSVSSSPYGRTHVWKHRQRVLPKPFVPEFPQLVVRVDGSTFTHYTTSPRSVIRLAKDTTNTPLWNPIGAVGAAEEEDAVTGRLGRFNRRFEGLGGYGAQDVQWMEHTEGAADGMSLQKMKMEAEKVMKSKSK
ncbi:hypothetical protein DAEQUDRAFT_768207 [Daedalea quercina L-15889]|uniref:MICOS complex subunit n=1 Tax=Daedalea quercina L-15889 TaxID=1314783 RepID=A0A165MVE6_9APHY|nr:hypothetical protein DAEQUDRAFT_768207 [Daedalea quercina L-15889]